jgi:hypothetical protein
MPETLVTLEGGIDNRSASISAPKGSLSACYNFEKDQGPGYVKRLGWVRYDGRVTGPENDACVVFLFPTSNLTGLFNYGEQVRIQSAGKPDQYGLAIGTAGFGGGLSFLALSYPLQDFPIWADITSYPTSTTLTGLQSAAFVSPQISNVCLMNDATLTILQYDFIKAVIQDNHSFAVKACPGRNESPIDCIFTYNNNSYAIHDCVIFTFTNGGTGASGLAPLEGHCIRDQASGNFLGKILAVNTTVGGWGTGSDQVSGTFVVYDYPLGQAFPANTARLDLYDATNTTLLNASFARYSTAAPAPVQTRALLYSTYEQYVKTQPMTTTALTTLPVGPPTWTRVRNSRELGFSCATGAGGTPISTGFGATGTNLYSIYEYSRQGINQGLQALSPITLAEQPPTVASESSTVLTRWTTINNIKVQDGANAVYAVVAVGLVTDQLFATAFDFSSIPAGSVITGLKVRLHWNNTIGAASWIDEDVHLVGSMFPSGHGTANKATQQGPVLAAAYSDFTYGSATDTWGEDLTVAVLQDSTFGVSFRFKHIANAAALLQVDFIGMTVTYVPPSRLVYIRDPNAVTVTDVIGSVLHYQVDQGDFITNTAVGVLHLTIGATEAAGTAAGKARRIGALNEIRDAPSTGANVPHGNLLGYTTGEDYPVSWPASASLDNAVSRYEVIDANFWDVPEGRCAYWVNGVEYATQFDGINAIRIHTGRPTVSDNPRHIAAHGSPTPFLYLGFQSGAVVNTGAGHPCSYILAPAASVKNFGEPITGMLSLNGQTLGVWTDRATRGIQGNNPDPGPLNTSPQTPIVISPAINCIEYTLINLVGEAVWTSYRGVETIRTVNAYGDFETLPLSAPAQLWLQPRIQVDSRIGSRPSRALYAIGVRNKRQYRLFFADGYVFTLTLFDAGDQPVCTTQRLIRPNTSGVEGNVNAPYNNEPWNSGVIRHVYNGTRTDGKELILASFENQNSALVTVANGSSIGPYFPYGVRLDCGYNDDVMTAMPSWIELNAIYSGFPSQLAKWGSGTIFMNAYGGTIATILTRVDFDGPIIDQASTAQAITAPTFIANVTLDIFEQQLTLPIIEARAFIPVPQRTMVYNLSGEGRCMKMRIDATQTQGTNPAVVPLRLTHLTFSTDQESIDKS